MVLKKLLSKAKIFLKDIIWLGQVNKFLYAPKKPIGLVEMNKPQRKIKIHEIFPATKSVAEYNKDLMEIASSTEIREFKPEVILNPVYVADIHNGRFMTDGSDIAIMASDRALLEHFSNHYELDSAGRDKGTPNQERNNLYSQRYYYPPKKIKGTVMNMHIGGGDCWYGHFIWELLPGYHLVEKSGLINEVDFFYFQSIDFRFQKEILALLNINLEKVITYKDTKHFVADRLITFSYPNTVYHTPFWLIDFLRSKFLKMIKPDTKQFSKLFISRKDSMGRNIINEDDIFGKLEPLGFKRIICSDYSFLDGVKIFNSAEIIIGPYGSNLMNIIFCKPNTAIIEVFPDDFVNPDFALLALRLKLKHNYILAPAVKNGNDRMRFYSNMILDEKVLFQKLKEIE